LLYEELSSLKEVKKFHALKFLEPSLSWYNLKTPSHCPYLVLNFKITSITFFPALITSLGDVLSRSILKSLAVKSKILSLSFLIIFCLPDIV